MKTIDTKEQELHLLEEKFLIEITQIQHHQKELDDLHEILNKTFKDIKPDDASRIDTVAFKDLFGLRQLSDTISRKVKEQNRRIIKLYQSVFPRDVFVSQEFYDSWIRMDQNLLIRFSADLESIEVKEVG